MDAGRTARGFALLEMHLMSGGTIGNDGDEGQLTVVAGTSASTAERHDGVGLCGDVRVLRCMFERVDVAKVPFVGVKLRKRGQRQVQANFERPHM